MDILSAVVWAVLFAVFVIAEIATAGTLVSIWFCFGALAAMFAALGGASLTVQTVIFIVVSVVLLVLTKPFAKKLINSRVQKTNAPALIGKHGTVTETVENTLSKGAVKIDGKIWSARTLSDKEIIPEGERVVILDIQGVKLIVKKEEQ